VSPPERKSAPEANVSVEGFKSSKSEAAQGGIAARPVSALEPDEPHDGEADRKVHPRKMTAGNAIVEETITTAWGNDT